VPIGARLDPCREITSLFITGETAVHTLSQLPNHVPEQVALYQGDHLIVQPVCRFDVPAAAAMLDQEQDVMAIDLGGDKLRKAVYRFGGGRFERTEEEDVQARGGAGYLDVLETLAREAAERGLAVGISSATKMEGSIVTRTVNLPIFFADFQQRWGADFLNLFGARSFVANDTITGICGASTHLASKGIVAGDVAFVICASGVGASVIVDGLAIHVEAAHVPLVNALNPLGQTTACHIEGREFVCLERVAAIRAGIEDLYRQRTGDALDGVAIGRLYESGDPLATMLFTTSARALAHAIEGILERFSFPTGRESVVVLHGGGFEVAPYRDAVCHDLVAIAGGHHPRPVFSRDLTANACLDGAAVLGLYYTTQSRPILPGN
jgi:predicted NBD/HSP70 family sugar kinase